MPTKCPQTQKPLHHDAHLKWNYLIRQLRCRASRLWSPPLTGRLNRGSVVAAPSDATGMLQCPDAALRDWRGSEGLKQHPFCCQQKCWHAGWCLFQGQGPLKRSLQFDAILCGKNQQYKIPDKIWKHLESIEINHSCFTSFLDLEHQRFFPQEWPNLSQFRNKGGQFLDPDKEIYETW